MYVDLWRLVVTLLAAFALLIGTAAVAHGTPVDLVQVDDHGPLSEPGETSDTQDDCEPMPPPADVIYALACAATEPRDERPEDIDPSNDRPPPRS